MLFSDLVGSNALATQLDPEEWRSSQIIIARRADAVERFGGYVAQYLRDGVTAYFGWPHPTEQHLPR